MTRRKAASAAVGRRIERSSLWIVSFDPALRSTGCARLDGTCLTMHDRVVSSPDECATDALVRIAGFSRLAVQDALSGARGRDDGTQVHVAIEDPWHSHVAGAAAGRTAQRWNAGAMCAVLGAVADLVGPWRIHVVPTQRWHTWAGMPPGMKRKHATGQQTVCSDRCRYCKSRSVAGTIFPHSKLAAGDEIDAALLAEYVAQHLKRGLPC